MRAPIGDRLRLTVLGCSTAAPHPASPTAGFLVEWGDTALLLDVGQGVIRNLQRVLDPLDLTGVIREELVLDVPTLVLCREDCAGLCPTCGADLNAGPCACVRSAEPA